MTSQQRKHYPTPSRFAAEFGDLELHNTVDNPRWQYPAWRLQFTGVRLRPKGQNFRIIDERLWGSAQPNLNELETLRDRGLARVLCLRNDIVGPLVRQVRWGDAVGIPTYITGWSSVHPPNRTQLLRLVQIYQQLPKLPGATLIHCSAGADRTGFAAALYLHLIAGQSVEQASQTAFHPRYGHKPRRRDGIQSAIWRLALHKDITDMAAWFAEEYDQNEALTFWRNTRAIV